MDMTRKPSVARFLGRKSMSMAKWLSERSKAPFMSIPRPARRTSLSPTSLISSLRLGEQEFRVRSSMCRVLGVHPATTHGVVRRYRREPKTTSAFWP